MNIIRLASIWLFGLIAAGLVGSGIGTLVDRYNGGFFGFVAGVCVFACARLWMKDFSKS